MEKKKPKAEKNKKKSASVPSVFERVRMIGKETLPARSSRSSVRLNPAEKSPQRRAHSVPKSALGEARQSECYKKLP
jgi:hypothetical protein